MPMIKSSQKADEVRHQHAGGDQHYATPVSLAYAGLLWLSRYLNHGIDAATMNIRIHDAGLGNWGPFGFAAREIWQHAEIFGSDIRQVTEWPWYRHSFVGQDFTTLNNDSQGNDITIGNPPFKHGEKFVRSALDQSTPGGYTFLLLPLAFLESHTRGTGLFVEYPPKLVLTLMKRPTWWLYDDTEQKKRSTNARAYAFFLWETTLVRRKPVIDWLEWDYDDKFQGLEYRFREATGQSLALKWKPK